MLQDGLWRQKFKTRLAKYGTRMGCIRSEISEHVDQLPWEAITWSLLQTTLIE